MIAKPVLTLLVLALGLVAAGSAWSQSSWEGPTGAYLNPLALNLARSQVQGGTHYLDLQPAGALTTFGVSYGLTNRLEIGVTQNDLSVGSAAKVNVLHAKYLLRPLAPGQPGVAVGAVWRSATQDTADFYAVATQIFPTRQPLIASVTVRSTNARGSGLFGRAAGRSIQWGGFLGVQVTPHLIPNVEYLAQAEGEDWADVGVRYVVNANTNWDFGLADVGGDFGNQFAFGVTHKF